MKSKAIAIAILIFVYAVPFRMAFLSDEIAHSVSFIFAFLATLIGFLIAFGIGTNEPFDRKPAKKKEEIGHVHEMKRAA